jgi:hypothetical protein
MNQENFLLWLKRTEVPLSKISKKTGVSRSTLYKWMEGGPIRKRNMEKVVKGYSTEITLYNESINLNSKNIDLGGSKHMEAQRIIDNQERLINYQEKEIKSLKEIVNKKQAESTHWEALEYDFICNVTLYREGFRFGRVINKVTDLELQANKLGYSVDKMKSFWDVGVKHTKLESHPIEALIDTETQKQIQKNIATLPLIFDAMKSLVGNHYIPQPIIYKHKNGKNVMAISYNKVEWMSLNVISKVKFLTD